MRCNICEADCGAPLFTDAGPSITSLSTVSPEPLSLWLCRRCGHAQKPAIDDLATFYDTGYGISLASEDHDQLYERQGDRLVYRTEKQAEIMLSLTRPPEGAAVLDYGAAKATTLARMARARPDLTPHVFDVSRDYRAAWAGWIAEEAQAVYEIPAAWRGRFALVSAHFVLEHVADPVATLREMAGLLAPGGEVFATVPDPAANPGDLMVLDHVNGFTASSLLAAGAAAGLDVTLAPAGTFRGAHVAVMRAGSGAEVPADRLAADIADVEAAAANWPRAAEALTALAQRPSRKAIYGAGFYGAWIGTRLGLGGASPAGDVACYLDANAHANGGDFLGLPVLDPFGPLPPVTEVVAALNPKAARGVLDAWRGTVGRSDLPVTFLT